MTDLYLVRLDTMQGQLQELIARAEGLQHVSEIETKTLLGLLASSINRFSGETLTYMKESGTNVSAEKINEYTATQIKAEEWKVKLETCHKSEPTNRTTVKLPLLELPKFNGNILNFSEFWDRFESNIDKTELSPADKLSYLLGCLEGSALKMLEGLGTTNANYKIAVRALVERYGQKEIVVDAHYQALNQLPKANNTAGACRATYNSIERHLRILESLGENIDGNHFRATIISKFPDELIYNLNLTLQQRSMLATRRRIEQIITAMELSKKETLVTEEPMISTRAMNIYTEAKKSVPRRFQHNKSQTANKTQSKDLKRRMSDSKDAPNKKKRMSCIFCEGGHYNSECPVVKTVKERKMKLGKRCYKCFKNDHMSTKCPSSKSCYFCKGMHNQALCPQKESTDITNMFTQSKSTSCNLNYKSLLQTATAEARAQSRSSPCRVLLDSGSQRSYITTQLAKKLNISPVKEDLLMIYVFGSDTPLETLSPSTEIEIETKRGVKRTIQVNIVPHITNKLPIPPKLDNFKIDILADDGSTGENIDMLIGNDHYFTFIRKEYVKVQENLFLIDTDFGWMATGKMQEADNGSVLSVITYCQCQEPRSSYLSAPDLPLRDTDLRFLWALENIGISDSPKITREEETVKHFNQTVKFEDQRYQVKWPWILYPPELPTNYGLAYGRLTSLVKRLNQETKESYDSILQEQLKAGVIEVLEPQPTKIIQTTPPIHYLPHHIIMQPGKQGRIVYDASAKVKESKSLNECMYRGPSMIEDLTALLLQFRLNKIGITADIEKAFLQVGLQEEDRDVTRFLWLKDINKEITEENLIHMRFSRVCFGIVASPFLLTATIRYHLSSKDESLLKEIANKCYVDNLVTGTDSVENARKMINRTKEVFAEISMNIREWTSNDQKLMKSVPCQFRGKDTDKTKVLGLMWYLKSDTLKLKLSENVFNEERAEKNPTKRSILHTLASLYDPCGFAAPLILPAKLLIQETWKRKLQWDTPLPEDLLEHWDSAAETLKMAKEIEIPRFVGCTANDDTECELHCFTDASQKAYAAAVYLRLYDKKMNSHSTVFLMAKSRVTPITYKEDLKIPRLELLGYLIGNRLLTYVKKTLALPITRQCLWTDSVIILCWMRSEKLLPPFVSRRVAEIKENKDIEYRYVNTDLNPADLATRPELWESKKELWFNGPQFLSQNEHHWPIMPQANQSSLLVAGEGPDDNPDADIEQSEKEMNREVMESEDSVKKDDQTQGGNDGNKTNHLVTEIKKLQQTHFPQETSGVETHLTRNLGLFIDVDGILRCRGRLMNLICSYDTKHPILIPKDSQFTDDLIRETHEKNHHVGASHTLSIIRQHYWIPQGKAKVQRIIKQCSQCVRHGGGPYKLPDTPALPTERANYSAPFTYTGIDYFGPIFVNETEKRWVCLFTCLAVRAIHMEIVKDLTAEECLLALRRFISSRGVPELIVSDNALQFKLSSELLSSTYCIQEKIRWKFIPQLSPWHGGFYERLIGLVKNCLKRTLGKQKLNDTQLHTVIKEVEAVTNSRPLTYVGSDIDYVLKPADFLTVGRCIIISPSTNQTPPGGTITKQDLIESWKKGQAMLEEFKKMFIGQYLFSLRERYQHSHRQPRVRSHRIPRVNDIVQIKGDSKNRETWKTGRITALLKGQDGECRVARVVVEGKEFTRSIGLLYPLEIEESLPVTPNTSDGINPSLLECAPPETEIHALEEEENLDQEVGRTIPPADVSGTEPHSQRTPERTEHNETIEGAVGDDTETESELHPENFEERRSRGAAIRAREKIAEWTRLLAALL